VRTISAASRGGSTRPATKTSWLASRPGLEPCWGRSSMPPVLSLILCSRNDQYMGNSRWRLETTLGYIGDRVAALGREDDVEIVVADWGSEVPLREALTLSPAAAKIVSFLWIPPVPARELQRDSPFPEVLALNAAARRARGTYIGRIDQDTLVGERFLTRFLEWADGGWPLDVRMDAALFFANRRAIPYRFASRCPPLHAVERLIQRDGQALRIETWRIFYRSDVGVWLLHRNLWFDCGGYDERMIHMNSMEIEMIGRLMPKYPMLDLGKLVDYDFYHLDHYHPSGSRRSSSHCKVNDGVRAPLGFNPNGESWGCAPPDENLLRRFSP